MKNLIILSELDKNNLYVIVRENLLSCQTKDFDISQSSYHHNTQYKLVPSIIKYGILSYSDKNKLDGHELTPEERINFNEDGHVNGVNAISLTDDKITEKDLYRDEILHGHDLPHCVDICIKKSLSDSLFVHRDSSNYADEFLAEGTIDPKYFSSINLRILKYISTLYDESKILDAIEKYNYIILMAEQMLKNEINIPLIEVSQNSTTLDIKRINELPKILLKR